MFRRALLAVLIAVPLACASGGGQPQDLEPIPTDDWCAFAMSPELVQQQTQALLAIEGLYDDETQRQVRDAAARYRQAYTRCRR